MTHPLATYSPEHKAEFLTQLDAITAEIINDPSLAKKDSQGDWCAYGGVDWSPSTRWDHAGILIGWAEKKGRRLFIAPQHKRRQYWIGEFLHRTVKFVEPMEVILLSKVIKVMPGEDLTPAVITEAFVKAFGGE
jgi:hypothetical protein